MNRRTDATGAVERIGATLKDMPELKPVQDPQRERLTNLDQGIKQLLKDHPVDTLEFLLPDASKAWGKPLSWEFLNTTTRKHDLTRNLFTLAAEVGKLTLKEVEAYMKKTQLRSEAVEWLEAHFEAKAKLDDARKMLEHGMSWNVITDITGLKPADLKKAAKAAPARKLAKK